MIYRQSELEPNNSQGLKLDKGLKIFYSIIVFFYRFYCLLFVRLLNNCMSFLSVNIDIFVGPLYRYYLSGSYK